MIKNLKYNGYSLLNLQVKIQKDLKEKDIYKNEKLINDKKVSHKKDNEERVNYCLIAVSNYILYVFKNKQKLNSKNK